MKFGVSFEIDLELAKEQIVKEIKEYEDKTDTAEKIQKLIQLNFIKSLIEKLEVKNDLLNQYNFKIASIRRRENYLKELQSKLDNMEQHTAILNEEKEEMIGLIKLKTQEVKKLKVEIDVFKI